MNSTKSVDTNSSYSQSRVVFFGDVHLGLTHMESERFREELLLCFLRSLKENTGHVYILGDLFDFWFEYRSVITKQSPKITFELYNLVQSGVKITYIVGNHDFWVGDYFSKELGVYVAKEPVTCTHQGKKMFLHHGDGLYSGDHGYKLLKKVLRSTLCIKLFSIIHPDVGAWIARLCSFSSRKFLAKPPPVSSHPSDIFKTSASQKFREGYDAVVFGHCHIPYIETTDDNKTLLIIGDWIHHFTYGVLENGKFRLEHFTRNKS